MAMWFCMVYTYIYIYIYMSVSIRALSVHSGHFDSAVHLACSPRTTPFVVQSWWKGSVRWNESG